MADWCNMRARVTIRQNIPNSTGLLLPLLTICAGLCLSGCDVSVWNNPYPARENDANILYSSFSERPKHLDPARAYSSNEYVFIAQIYEPPLQYHFLKRPYELVPLTAEAVPQPEFVDAAGNSLPADAPAADIAQSVYRVRVRPGIRYQPHPAFCRDAAGAYRFHQLAARELDDIHVLSDFDCTDTRELTAADYVYQVKRLAHPGLQSPIAGLMGEYIAGLDELGGRLEAARGHGHGEGQWLDLREYPLAGARVLDRYTWEVRIEGKYPQFVYWLAMPFFSPMPWEADRFYAQPGLQEKNITLDWYPVGSGAFMLTENNPNLRMVMEKNPNFHGEDYPDEGMADDRAEGFLDDAGKPMPFIERAVYSLEKEDIPYWNKFLQGYYDVSGIASDSFDQAISFSASGEAELTDAMQEQGIRLLTAVSASTFYIGFNMLDETVGGYGERARKLRQAISIAVDMEEMIAIFRNGRGIAAQGPVAPGIFGYREGGEGINPVVYEWRGGRAVRRPLADAKRLLAEAGYPDGRDAVSGRPLLLHFDTAATGPDSKAYTDWLRKQLDKLGVQLVVRGTDYNRFQEKMRKGTAQIYQWGWNADYPDPENFMFLLYGPNAKVGGNGENASNYSNPEFDRLFEQMKSMDNTPARQQVIDRMLDIARRDAPWIWGSHPKAFTLHHAWYGNARPNLMANNTLKYKRIDPALRAERRRQWNRPVLWPLLAAALVLAVSVVPAFVIWRRREHRVVK